MWLRDFRKKKEEELIELRCRQTAEDAEPGKHLDAFTASIKFEERLKQLRSKLTDWKPHEVTYFFEQLLADLPKIHQRIQRTAHKMTTNRPPPHPTPPTTPQIATLELVARFKDFVTHDPPNSDITEHFPHALVFQTINPDLLWRITELGSPSSFADRARKSFSAEPLMHFGNTEPIWCASASAAFAIDAKLAASMRTLQQVDLRDDKIPLFDVWEGMEEDE